MHTALIAKTAFILTLLNLCSACDTPDNSSTRSSRTEPCAQSQEQLEAERIMLENFSLKREIESLKNALEAEQAKNVALLGQTRSKIEAIEKERKQITVTDTKETEKQKLKTKLQNTILTLDDLSEILNRQNKTTVIYLLGQPDKRKKPSSSDSFFYEVWEYKNKVRKSDKEPIHTLLVFFDNDTVNHLEAGK